MFWNRAGEAVTNTGLVFALLVQGRRLLGVVLVSWVGLFAPRRQDA